MKFIILIHTDPGLLAVASPDVVEEALRQCFAHTDALRASRHLLDAQMLAAPESARTIRARAGRQFISDGAFAESKEVLGGFNLIEARDMDEAQEIAEGFPWSRFGRLEIRPVLDLQTVREAVAMAPCISLASS